MGVLDDIEYGKGRKLIIVDQEITPNTIKDVIINAWTTFKANKYQIQRLIDIYCGKQNTTYSVEGKSKVLENKTTVNYNYSTVRTIVGYTYSQGAQIVQRKANRLKDIEKLVDTLNYENTETKDTEAGTFASICGLSYLGIFPTKELYSDYMPDYPLVTLALDPRNTFVVCSPEPGNPVKLSVTYYVSKEKNKTVFYCYTDTECYKIECPGQDTFTKEAEIVDRIANPIKLNPIILVKNNQFMQGDFELAIEVADAINMLAADALTDIDNVIKSLLVIINAELTKDEAEKARANKILQLIGQPGMSVDAKFIYQQLDSIGMQNLREYFEEAYRTIVGIPDRKTRSGGGGDTGDAVKLRDGWADIEIVARIKESYFKIAKKKQVAVAIKILQLLGLVSKNFKLEDIDITLPRNKHDNIQTKAQTFATLMGTGKIAPSDALAFADLTTDISGVISRGEEYHNQLMEEEQKQEEQKQKELKQVKQAENVQNNEQNG